MAESHFCNKLCGCFCPLHTQLLEIPTSYRFLHFFGLHFHLLFNEISSLPDYTDVYGQGGDNSVNVGFVGNWGGRFDDNITVRHHYDQPQFAVPFPEFQGVNVPYQNFKNNIKDFFRISMSTR